MPQYQDTTGNNLMRIDSGIFSFSSFNIRNDTLYNSDSTSSKSLSDSLNANDSVFDYEQFSVSTKKLNQTISESSVEKENSISDFNSTESFSSDSFVNQILFFNDNTEKDTCDTAKNQSFLTTPKANSSEIKIESHNFISNLFRKQNSDISNDWIIVVVLSSFIILSWIKFFYKKFISKIIFSSFDYQNSIKLFQEKNSLSFKISFAIYLIYLINFGLFLSLLFKYYDYSPFRNGILLFATLCLLLIIIDIFKALIYRFLGYLFLCKSQFSEFLFNDFIIFKSFAIFLYPIIVAIPFMPEMFTKYLIYIGLGLFSVFYILHVLRGMKIFVKKHFYLSYMILYLCTLEILPLLIVLKFVNALL